MGVVALGLVLLSFLTVVHSGRDTVNSLANSVNIALDAEPVDRDVNATETGRGKKIEKFIFPLMMGFKLTGLAIAAFTALKIFIVQSLVISNIALLGALGLVFKAIYEHMKHKFMHAKMDAWEIYPYHGISTFPEWRAEDWAPDYTLQQGYLPSGDLNGLPSEQIWIDVPHAHNNKTFSLRSDVMRDKSPPQPIVVGYDTVITKITETTQD